MFDSSTYPQPLDEEKFEQWLEDGRNHKIGYHFLLIVWDDLDGQYKPVYTSDRETIEQYEGWGTSQGNESLIAAYDLYSESRLI